jgi:hypothetical protein
MLRLTGAVGGCKAAGGAPDPNNADAEAVNSGSTKDGAFSPKPEWVRKVWGCVAVVVVVVCTRSLAVSESAAPKHNATPQSVPEPLTADTHKRTTIPQTGLTLSHTSRSAGASALEWASASTATLAAATRDGAAAAAARGVVNAAARLGRATSRVAAPTALMHDRPGACANRKTNYNHYEALTLSGGLGTWTDLLRSSA